MPRSLDQLRRDQDAILAAYRAETSSLAPSETRAASSSTFTGCAYGRVTEVVTSDENLGPHLLVMRQAWTGTPPVPSDAGLAALVAYPLPGHAVTEFQVDQLVRLDFLPGATLAQSA